MRHLTKATLIVAALSFPNLASAQTTPAPKGDCSGLTGNWQMMSYTSVSPTGERQTYTDAEFRTLKILSGDRYLFIRQYVQGDSIQVAGGGRHQSGGGKHVVHREFNTYPPSVGTTVTYDCEVQGDRWIISLRNPNGGSVREVWRPVN